MGDFLKVSGGALIGIIIAFVTIICLCLCCCLIAIYSPSSSPVSNNGFLVTDNIQITEPNTNNTDNQTNVKIYGIGDTVKIDDKSITVTEGIEHQATDSIGQPAEGNKFVAVNVVVENTSTNTVSYNFFNYNLINKNGENYSVAILGAKKPSLNSGDLQPGRKAVGYITFEIPKDIQMQDLEFVYEPLTLLSNSQVIWSLK